MIFNHQAEPAQATAHIAYEVINEAHPQLVIIEFLSHAIADPAHSAELAEQLASLVRPEFPKRFVLDFENVRLMSSSAFWCLGLLYAQGSQRRWSG